MLTRFGTIIAWLIVLILPVWILVHAIRAAEPRAVAPDVQPKPLYAASVSRDVELSQSPTPLPTLVPVPWTTGTVTHYGTSYQGLPLGCSGYGTYNSHDPSIIAVAYPSRQHDLPCGTVIEVRGPHGTIVGTRVDSCPGCGYNHLDLSEAGIVAVCGSLGRCDVEFRVVQ